MGCPSLHLEPQWDQLRHGDKFDCLANCIFWDPQGLRHVMQSVIHRQTFILEGKIDRAFAYSLMQASVKQCTSGLRAFVASDTVVYAHDVPSVSSAKEVVELCAGIGVMTEGLESSGASIKASNDLRENFCRFQVLGGNPNVIHGDIGILETQAKVFHSHPKSAMYTAGFSCQPWSRLGDGRKINDGRASTLRHALRAAFFSRAHSVLLECVVEAGQDDDVQSQLREFCSITGFKAHQVDLRLEDIWPAKRHRWWCLITNPAVGHFQLRPFPKHPKHPCVSDLLPCFPTWPERDIQQLILGLYETNKFLECGTFHQSLIKGNGPLSTALHGWGNQLDPCPCGCRKGPMSFERLLSKGLYGALVLVGDGMQGQQQLVPAMPSQIPISEAASGHRENVPQTRHIHPWELALLSGVCPNRDWQGQLKLALCGLGQMASPLHSCWIMAQFVFQMGRQFQWDKVPTPEESLWSQMTKVFQAYQTTFPQLFAMPTVQAFVNRSHSLLFGHHTAQHGIAAWPSPDSRPADPADTQVPPSCAEATQDIKEVGSTTVQDQAFRGLEHVEDHTPKVSTLPVGFTSSPLHDPHVLDRCCVIGDGVEGEATRNREHPRDTNSPTSPLQAIVDDGYGADVIEGSEQRECQYDDCFICHPELLTIPVKDMPQSRPEEKHESVEVSPTLPFTIHSQVFDDAGGLIAFSSRKRPIEDNKNPISKRAKMASASDGSNAAAAQVTQLELTKMKTEETVAHAGPPQGEVVKIDNEPTFQTKEPLTVMPLSEDTHCIQVFNLHADLHPLDLRVNKTATVGSITVAEDKLGTLRQPINIVDIIGQPISLGSLSTSSQQVFLRPCSLDKPLSGHQSKGPTWTFDGDQPVSRITALLQQEAWVARDELDFYLSQLSANENEVVAVPSVYDTDTLDFSEWAKLTLLVDSPRFVATAVLSQNHWHPWVIEQSARETRIFTTQPLIDVTRCALTDVVFVPIQTRTVFRADCGFQTLGAIVQIITDPTLAQNDQRVPITQSLTVEEAIAWRVSFEQHLIDTGLGQKMVVANRLALGGGPTDPIQQELETLLTSHGVPASEITSRVNAVLTKLGRSSVAQSLRSHKPWTELKAISNQQTPKLQLVLPSELAEVIRERATKGVSIGDKGRKKPKGSKEQSPITLRAEDVSIPDGLFKQGDSELIGQLALQNMGPNAKGIVVVQANQAAPYLRLNQPVSKQGLALLVINHDDPVCAGVGQVIRFPGRHERTGEPFIGTARLIQLGSAEVSRHIPANQTFVDEVETAVVRLVCFRDEITDDWESFVSRPVKYALDTMDLSNANTGGNVVDVWDRQFLSTKLDRQPPKQADLFMVSLRLTDLDSRNLMKHSGHKGVYVEPRSVDGRAPDPLFRVLWLPKMDRASVVTAQQTAPMWTCLVRSGARFGLRSTSQEAPKLHELHKPSTPYLDATSLVHYTVGPLPYGANRASLIKVFETWGWAARPLQPRGKSSDGGGLIWEVQAATPPPCEVYSMTHSDVLVAEIPRKKPNDKVVSDIIASAKTLSALREKTRDEPATKSAEPFETDDPWASYTPVSKQPRVAHEPSHLNHPGALEKISQQVDKKVTEAIAQVEARLNTNDANMGSPDHRVDQLETRMNQLEQALQISQAQQQQYQGQVSSQFSQMQRQIEAQGSQIESHLDRRMSEQLQQIEQLLGKKQCHE